MDTSFLVSIYVTDRHSPDARLRISSVSPPRLTELHQAEWAHAIAQHIFRGQLSPGAAQQVEKLFEQDRAEGIWLSAQIGENAFDVCANLGRRYGPKLGVRTLDSLHVASALELNATRFWTFDDRQLKLAKAVGLDVH